MNTTVVLITGHPATGKTTLAYKLAEELGLPLICKDQIKESLVDSLGTSTTEWSRRLSSATWSLLYLHVENLLKAKVSHLVESNFDPVYANEHWQRLKQTYDFQLIQIRCETEPKTLLHRYRQRIEDGNRHAGHVDTSKDQEFLASIQQHMDWVMVDSEKIPFDTTEINEANDSQLIQKIRTFKLC